MRGLTDEVVYVITSSWGLHSVHATEQSAEQWRHGDQIVQLYGVIDNPPAGVGDTVEETP